MVRRRSREGLQSNTVEQMGLGHDVPTPDFSDQPDSGGRIGGIRGEQEYGIKGGMAGNEEDQPKTKDVASSAIVEEILTSAEGFQDFSEDERSTSEEEFDFEWEEDPQREEEQEEEVSTKREIEKRKRPLGEGEELRILIEDRLQHNPALHVQSLQVSVLPVGLVSVSGNVQSEAQKIRVTEIVGALPGVVGIRNSLLIRSEMSATS